MSADPGTRRARTLLALGSLTGVLLAAFSIGRSGVPERSLPADAVALVNGQPVSRDALERYREGLDARGTSPLPESEGIARLVDEELLFQRGLELGLARQEPNARRAIVAAVVALATADSEYEEPDSEALEAFYAEHPERFASGAALRFDAYFVATPPRPEAEAHARASEIAEGLRAGEDADTLRSRLADATPAVLDSGSLPLAALRDALGSAAARVLTRVAPGTVTDPLRAPAGYAVLVVHERIPGPPLPYARVAAQVREEFRRQRAGAALEAYLADLRRAADVQLDAPPADPGE